MRALFDGRQILIFGCMVIFANANGPDLKLGNGLYDVNKPLTSACESTCEIDFYVANQSYPCNAINGQPPYEEDFYRLDNIGIVVSLDGFDKEFNISQPALRVYNVWCKCKLTSLVDCKYAIMYNIDLSEDGDLGLTCSLSFANDGVADFVRPTSVELLTNGKLEGADASKDLVADDFKNISNAKFTDFKLESTESLLPGHYECKFTQSSDAPLTAIYVKEGKPLNAYMRFNPLKQQYMDGDSLSITCAFSGYPPPNITWYQDGVMLSSGYAVVQNGSLTISSIELKDIDDKVDKGLYECMAANYLGDDSATKILHARDTLAPLWPFIGIVIQVIVLVICIGLGERYRKKKLAEKRQLALTEETKNS